MRRELTSAFGSTGNRLPTTLGDVDGVLHANLLLHLRRDVLAEAHDVGFLDLGTALLGWILSGARDDVRAAQRQ